ncbi:diphthamide biosynthesis protein [Gonapodya prolifera JEL478]|uniref:2-(3-amino-3-carboxypropyl)histidine synthase subunit 2 n=1 Tax=Gonapodya prolifera (strain JEL478) TaxID=1344416 RepID=A0A139ALB5_GONPJ|nr:diphthamide biosynthesis protein [Gonapodya prolifera JEL478]|eukprot:KXS17540.1 diphthamide biosynthesis protein [Gonapodya prolifera JEL478]
MKRYRTERVQNATSPLPPKRLSGKDDLQLKRVYIYLYALPIQAIDNSALPSLQSDDSFDQFFELSRTVDVVSTLNASKIALQFPDELLAHAPRLVERLKARFPTTASCFILADSTYGSCCVDEVAAKHVDSDLIVHYGHSCLSLPSATPTLFVFGKRHLDLEKCADAFATYYASTNDQEAQEQSGPKDTIALVADVSYEHNLAPLASILTSRGYSVHPHTIPPSYGLPNAISGSELSPKLDRSFPEGQRVFYIGPESLALTHLIMENARSEITSYAPPLGPPRLESAGVNRLLARRYRAVQRARDADVFGVVIGAAGSVICGHRTWKATKAFITMPRVLPFIIFAGSSLPLIILAHSLPLLRSLLRLFRAARRKHYVLSLGRPTPTKLANLHHDVDCFVLAACGENSLAVEEKEVGRAVVTPVEVALALRHGDGGEYEADEGLAGLTDNFVAQGSWTTGFEGVQRLVDAVAEHLETKERAWEEEVKQRADGKPRSQSEDSPAPHFSLVTGGLKKTRRGDGNSVSVEPQSIGANPLQGDVVLRDSSRMAVAQVVASIGSRFDQRTFRGLEERPVGDSPAMVQEGRSGVASGYEGEN